MGKSLSRALISAAVFAYGSFTVILYGLIALVKGTYFKRPNENEKRDLQLARNRLWDLSKDFEGLSHHILTLQSGFKFHFVSNDIPNTPETINSDKPLVIFIHGFPDSWAIWRHIIGNSALQEAVSLVAIDLPGYGGTESLEKYTATNVLEKLTELIVTLRTQYGVDSGNESNKKRTIIVAHDWGCVLSMRLAAEAPSLAHRFILSNGPSMKLVESNIRRLLFSAKKTLGHAWRSPLHARVPLMQAIRTLTPLARQLVLSGYIFAMQLPTPIVSYFLSGGNRSLLKSCHLTSYNKDECTPLDVANSMASTMGPSAAESDTKTPSGDAYPANLSERAFAHVIHMAAYYRDGAAMARWVKSIETVASLHSISSGKRMASSGAGLFDEGPPGALRASTTIFWGKDDIALDQRICLDGMGDYLVQGSQIVLLPHTGHWTPVERESGAALIKAVEWAAQGEEGDIVTAIGESYPGVQLLLSDNYLPGAMVLAHSLRDNGTKARLVALFTPDRLQSSTIDELRTVYDELIPVSSMVNDTPANLWLMDRPDLIATFTKIELWRLTQYQRVVYIDCDVVALRAPDELLSLEADFAAAPDVGWPDCFNSGMMVLRPNLQDYYALRALAQRGISFDGADQGLLNMHFRDWHRLSFTYNCTPSANYQYIPAYKHFQSTISLIHFIGAQKPWNMPRQIVPLESPYNQLLGRWWAVYDRHYRLPFVPITAVDIEKTVLAQGDQVHTPRRDTPRHEPPRHEPPRHEPPRHEPPRHEPPRHEPPRHDNTPHYEIQPTSEQQPGHVEELTSFHEEPHQAPPVEHSHSEPHHEHSAPANVQYAAFPVLSMVPQYVRGEEHVSTYISPLPPAPITFAPQLSHETYENQLQTQVQIQTQAQLPTQTQAPTHYPDGHIHQPQPLAPIHPPIIEYQSPPSPVEEVSTFEAPRSEWDPSREPPPVNTKPEGFSLQQKTYNMSEDTHLFQPPSSYPEAPKNMWYEVPAKPEPKPITIFPWEGHAPKPTRIFAEETPVEFVEPPVIPDEPEQHSLPSEPALPGPSPSYTRVPFEPSAESWQTYTRSNAWDEDPEIQRYIETIQARRTKSQVTSPGAQSNSPGRSPPTPGFRPSTKITDFPTEVERPSLPVTPAPIRRTSYGDEASGTAALPTAEGVPSQEEWVGVTVDVFSSLLGATYLLWRSTESPGSARGAASSALGGLGASRTAV
ncbi:Glycosyl transferase, family 8 [Penicillium expansum]|nr:Glycosyl transferase, family 8 [Penicillium expansum]